MLCIKKNLLNLIKEMGKDVTFFPATQNGPTFHKGSMREEAGDRDQTNGLGKVTLLLKFKLIRFFSLFFSTEPARNLSKL